MTSSGCSMKGGPSKKGKGTNRTGGSAILKLIWGGNGGVSGFAPDFTPEMLNRTRGTSNFVFKYKM